jgi:putative IMPACT (imprinted ancient) family translation regulator
LTQKEILVEGFDDDKEDGGGEKLLGVLQKMDVGNILIVVSVC